MHLILSAQQVGPCITISQYKAGLVKVTCQLVSKAEMQIIMCAQNAFEFLTI